MSKRSTKGFYQWLAQAPPLLREKQKVTLGGPLKCTTRNPPSALQEEKENLGGVVVAKEIVGNVPLKLGLQGDEQDSR